MRNKLVTSYTYTIKLECTLYMTQEYVMVLEGTMVHNSLILQLSYLAK